MIRRTIQEDIENSLFKRKIVIIYGARQVGKTTLVKEVQKNYPDSVYFNCDEPDIRNVFQNRTSTEIKAFIGKSKLIILDEAQRIKNVGMTLKLIVDNFPELQVIATGSSSFELTNKTAEPLTGRKYEFLLYPFSMEELKSIYSTLELNRLLEKRIIFGMYPEIVLQNMQSAKENLKSLAQSYVYKDVLQYQNIKNPEILEKLLQALALQIGNEVSYNELANMIGIDKNTVASYIRILEESFIVFRLGPWSRNLRNELKKLRKIYFYDTGIRNVLINNLNFLNLRQDSGTLWENFIIAERLKYNHNHDRGVRGYFWRTRQKQEIDYLEEEQGILSGFEFKWQKTRFKVPKIFSEAYPNTPVKVITKDNYQEFIF